MIRIDQMRLRLPAGTSDPGRSAHDAAAGVARALERAPASIDQLTVVVRHEERLDSATAAALDAHDRGER